MTDPNANRFALADAIRNLTAAMQEELDRGRRSTHIDANDMVDLLLAIADELDPSKR